MLESGHAALESISGPRIHGQHDIAFPNNMTSLSGVPILGSESPVSVRSIDVVHQKKVLGAGPAFRIQGCSFPV